MFAEYAKRNLNKAKFRLGATQLVTQIGTHTMNNQLISIGSEHEPLALIDEAGFKQQVEKLVTSMLHVTEQDNPGTLLREIYAETKSPTFVKAVATATNEALWRHVFNHSNPTLVSFVTFKYQSFLIAYRTLKLDNQ